MSIKSAKKLGFFISLTMLVGSVVGIGVFFKSHSILRSNDWNGIGTLLAWVVGGLLSLAAAISFSEISSFNTKNVHGLPGWTEKIAGKKMGYLVRFSYSFFYYGLLGTVLGVFGSEMFFNIFATFGAIGSVADVPMYVHLLVGIFLVVFFMAVNFVSARAGGIVQAVTTVLKWVPLLTVALAGLILATTNNSTHGNFGVSAFANGTKFSFTGMLAALPAVLFAFDAFIGVGTMRKKMKDENQLPMVVFVGMLSVLILYILIALSAVLHGSGMVSGAPFGAAPADGLGIFDQVFSHSAASVVGKLVVIFLAISAFGVINGISAGAVNVHEQAIKSDTIFGMRGLRKKWGSDKATIFYAIANSVFWTIAFGIPALILNSDSVIDGFSNFPTLFFFGVYAFVILLYALKRDQFETKKINKFVFLGFTWFAIIGITFVVFYQLSYGFLIGALGDKAASTHWGLFIGDNGEKLTLPTQADVSVGVFMSRYQSIFVFFSLFIFFVASPFINLFLIKKFEKRDPVIDTQVDDLAKVL